MARSRFGRATLLCGMLVGAASCRSILDIEPGRPLEDAAGSAGKSSGGKANTSGGSGSDGGAIEPQGGAPHGTAGKGNAGSKTGGSPTTAGSSSMAGENAGGAGGSAPTNPFPEGSCRDCMARNCAQQVAACVDAAGCSDGIAGWLECVGSVAADCVSADAGALQDLEACGAKSCDVCRHTDDGEPSVEILTPSNGAQISLDDTGLIEVSARVHNFELRGVGACAGDPNCGHVHFNIGTDCGVNAFFNTWEPDPNPMNGTVDDLGNVDAFIDTTQCDTSIKGKSVEIRASLSDATMHADRMPLIQSIVTVDIGN